MSRTVTTVLIDRAVEDVWVFLSDAQNLPAWCPEADQVTQLSDGPFATGTKLRVAGRIGPLRFRSTQQVTAFESHRRIELRSVDGLFGVSLLTRVDVKPDGTRTSLAETSDVQGLPRWLAILGPGRQKGREAFFARLKDSLEAQAQSATPPVADTVQPSAARTEPTTRDPDPEPLAESPPATPPPSSAAHPVASVYGTAVPRAEAEAPVTQSEAPIAQAEEAPTAQAEAPTAQAEEPTAQAEAPITEEDVPEIVGGPIAAADASLVISSEAGAVDVSPAPAVDEVRLVLRLETERGPSPTFEITRSGATIGRAPENTVRLDDLSVSRRHARVAYRQGGYWLSDLKSASGTWVDETKLTAPRRLAPGQSIRIGILRLSAMFVAASDELPTSSDGSVSPSELAGRGQGRR